MPIKNKLINDTLSNLIGGVTQQFQEGRFDNQVSDMVNCIPSPTRGVIRRNPISESVQLKDGDGNNLNVDKSFTYMYDRGNGVERYLIVVPGDGNWFVYRANTLTGEPISYSTQPLNYLKNRTILDNKEVFECVTIGDHTFILNKTIRVEMDGELTQGDKEYNKFAFYWIKKTTGIVVGSTVVTDEEPTPPAIESTTSTSANTLEGYKYTLNDVTVQGHSDQSADGESPYKVGALDAFSIATKLAELTPYVVDEESSFVYTHGQSSDDKWEWEDSFGNEASLGVWKTVSSSDQLPSRLPESLDGFICKIDGNNNLGEDDYYYKYNSSTSTWTETVAPGIPMKFNEYTMPQVFYRLSSGSGSIKFEFNSFQKVKEDGTGLTGISAWGEREVGDEESAPTPSFVGNYIKSIFFHKNRLGFISRENVIMSETAEYGNFFIQTVQEILDDDPIDIAVATTDVTVVRHAISSPNGLLLFADYDQFMLSAADGGVLTPKSAEVTTISHYTYNHRVKAAGIGNKIYFTSIIGSNTNMYAYQLADTSAQSTEAQNLTLHVPNYIPADVDAIVGHDVLGFTFLSRRGGRSGDVYVLNNTMIEGRDIQNAIHKWEFNHIQINSLHIINNRLFILATDGTYSYVELDIPSYIPLQEYADVLPTREKLTYNSKIIFSEFYLRDSTKMALYTGRTQIRTMEYAITEKSHYQTRIYNKDRLQSVGDTGFGPIWNDNGTWNDSLIWYDASPYYYRIYKDDSKVTVMGQNKTTRVIFEENEDYPTKGFELATVNLEYMFHQRSAYKE